MSESVPDTEPIRKALLLAKLLTGCNEGALAAVHAAADEVRVHPAAEDGERATRLFFAAVRRRCLKTPARNDLTGPLADLHRLPEPERSFAAMSALEVMDASGIDATLGIGSASLPLPPNIQEIRTAAEALPSPSADEAALARKILSHSQGVPLRVRNPAMIAVAFAFLLMIGVLVWQFTGQVGIFPEEALKIENQARRAGFDQFAPVQVKVADVPDWFAMQGMDGVRIPETFAGYDAVGVRTFKVEGETIAQVAALSGDQRVFFLSFPARPFGITVAPEKSWRITSSGRHVIALREEAGMCFLVSFEGDADAMRAMLGGAPPRPST